MLQAGVVRPTWSVTTRVITRGVGGRPGGGSARAPDGPVTGTLQWSGRLCHRSLGDSNVPWCAMDIYWYINGHYLMVNRILGKPVPCFLATHQYVWIPVVGWMAMHHIHSDTMFWHVWTMAHRRAEWQGPLRCGCHRRRWWDAWDGNWRMISKICCSSAVHQTSGFGVAFSVRDLPHWTCAMFAMLCCVVLCCAVSQFF